MSGRYSLLLPYAPTFDNIDFLQIANRSVEPEYGECGVGAFCLGGCDPLNSHSLNSCTPAPICKSDDYKLSSLDGITSNHVYLGDATQSNWVSSGTPKIYQDQLLLTLSQDGESVSGTLLASTSYLWYGKISAQMKSSRGAGVVTAFILLSDVKDEIDFEFVGSDLATAQSNYYFQGITNCKISHLPVLNPISLSTIRQKWSEPASGKGEYF